MAQIEPVSGSAACCFSLVLSHSRHSYPAWGADSRAAAKPGNPLSDPICPLGRRALLLQNRLTHNRRIGGRWGRRILATMEAQSGWLKILPEFTACNAKKFNCLHDGNCASEKYQICAHAQGADYYIRTRAAGQTR